MRARAVTAYAINDQKALGHLVVRMVKELGAGNEKVAAKSIGISQPTLNRYRNRKRATLSPRVATRLQSAVAKLTNARDAARQFTEAVLNPEVANIFDTYIKWQRDSLAAAGIRHPHPYYWYPQAPPSEPTWLRDHLVGDLMATGLDWLLWRMCKETPRDFARLEKAVRRQTIYGRRLSALRIFQPLLQHHDSFFVERGAQELAPEEFKTFIRAGVTREIILLNRPPDAQRAIKIQRDIIEEHAREFPAGGLRKRAAQKPTARTVTP